MDARMAFYLLLEDGVSKIVLEDATGFILVEAVDGQGTGPPGGRKRKIKFDNDTIEFKR